MSWCHSVFVYVCILVGFSVVGTYIPLYCLFCIGVCFKSRFVFVCFMLLR